MFTILRNSLYRGLLYRGLTVLYSLLGLLIYLSYDLSTLLLVSYLLCSQIEVDLNFIFHTKLNIRTTFFGVYLYLCIFHNYIPLKGHQLGNIDVKKLNWQIELLNHWNQHQHHYLTKLWLLDLCCHC